MWFGHVRSLGLQQRSLLGIELLGKKKRGRPKRRFTDAVRKYMTVAEVTEEDAEDRTERRWKIHDP